MKALGVIGYFLGVLLFFSAIVSILSLGAETWWLDLLMAGISFLVGSVICSLSRSHVSSSSASAKTSRWPFKVAIPVAALCWCLAALMFYGASQGGHTSQAMMGGGVLFTIVGLLLVALRRK